LTKNKILLCIAFIISLPVTLFAQDLDIYIKASQEDMNAGRFAIEFHETVSPGTVREFSFWGLGKIQNYTNTFVKSVQGTATYDETGHKIIYNFSSGGHAVYGYSIRPTASINGSGYCNKDIGIFDFDANFPHNIMWEDSFTEINLFFNIPETMKLYAPWGDNINNQVQLKTSSDSKRVYNISAWGNFTHIEKHLYGSHIHYLLAYGTDPTNNFKLAKITYDYYMKAFAYNYDYLPPVNLHIVLPDNEGYHPAGEGFGGAYMSNIVCDNWEPVFNDSAKNCGSDYFLWTQNGGALTVAPVHHAAHATFREFVNDCWWTMEGIAVYYQIVMLNKAGILNLKQTTREFIAHLECYQNEIVGTENDYPLKNFQASGLSNYVVKTIPYIKGALAFYIINEIIKETSNGQHELINFFTFLFKGLKSNYDISYNNFISMLNKFTRRDFTEFFEKFIYSNDPLPLKIKGDEIILTYMPPYKPDGDIAPLDNHDGFVDVGDALVCLRFALGLETPPSQEDVGHGDVAPLNDQGKPNPDGQITVGDALVILRKALGIISF